MRRWETANTDVGRGVVLGQGQLDGEGPSSIAASARMARWLRAMSEFWGFMGS